MCLIRRLQWLVYITFEVVEQEVGTKPATRHKLHCYLLCFEEHVAIHRKLQLVCASVEYPKYALLYSVVLCILFGVPASMAML